MQFFNQKVGELANSCKFMQQKVLKNALWWKSVQLPVFANWYLLKLGSQRVRTEDTVLFGYHVLQWDDFQVFEEDISTYRRSCQGLGKQFYTATFLKMSCQKGEFM